MPTEPSEPPPPSSETSPPLDAMSPGALRHMLAAGMEPPPGRFLWTPPEVAELREMLPDYEVQELIGRGGMGAVYRGVQKNLERAVAIKVLPPELGGEEPQHAVRFKQEAQAMARLSHPNIVAVHDFGQTGEGLLYLVMDHVEGADLQQVMKTQVRLPPREAAAIISQVCDALEFAHEKGVVHRDIKPSNVMMDRRGVVKVVDFGLAKYVAQPGGHPARRDASGLAGGTPAGAGGPRTMTGVVMGTLAYMAPEQALGKKVDHRADIYSVGALFYEMLTGEPPHGAVEPPSRRIAMDVRLDEVVMKALAQDPERRYQKAGEVKTDVVRCTGPHAAAVDDASAGRKTRRRAVVIAGVALAAAFVPAALFWQRRSGDGISRTSAEKALGLGGRVVVRNAAGKATVLNSGAQLPQGELQLLQIRFDNPDPNGPRLTPAELVELVRPAGLEALSFFQVNPGLSDEVFAAFGRLAHLRELNFNSPVMQDGWMRHLKGCKSLELLRIPQSRITDAGLRHLADIPGLLELDINDSHVTGACIVSLAAAEKLRLLRFGIRTGRLGAEEVRVVADRCRALREMHLTSMDSAECCRALAGLPELQSLAVSHVTITAEHFQVLAGCPVLSSVSMIACRVEKEAWSSLAALPRVSRLSFTQTRPTESAMAPLAGMKPLRSLSLTGVPAEDSAQLRAALPHVEVMVR